LQAEWRNSKAGLSSREQGYVFEDDMQQENELFDISRNTWQSFSSSPLVRMDSAPENIQALPLQWFYCDLSNHQVFILGVDRIVGYQLAADMLNEPIDTLSVEDEQDAVIELVNCICGQLDRDHPANECFGVPGPLVTENMNRIFGSLNKLADVLAKVGDAFFYIALFKAKKVEDHGDVE
jgi:hypothetical protein